MFLVSPWSCLCPSQVCSWEWRCSWSSADRRCSNCFWMINNFIAYKSAPYIRDFTVVILPRPHCINSLEWVPSLIYPLQWWHNLWPPLNWSGLMPLLSCRVMYWRQVVESSATSEYRSLINIRKKLYLVYFEYIYTKLIVWLAEVFANKWPEAKTVTVPHILCKVNSLPHFDHLLRRATKLNGT